MKPVGAPYASLSPVEVLRLRFWDAVRSYAEARWLEANGWRRARDGWLLPDWHPHKRHAGGSLGGFTRFDDVTSERPQLRKEPYTQNHASNSQRVHCERGTVQRRNSPRHKAPPFPTYTLLPYSAITTVASFFVTTFAVAQRTTTILSWRLAYSFVYLSASVTRRVELGSSSGPSRNCRGRLRMKARRFTIPIELIVDAQRVEQENTEVGPVGAPRADLTERKGAVRLSRVRSRLNGTGQTLRATSPRNENTTRPRPSDPQSLPRS